MVAAIIKEIAQIHQRTAHAAFIADVGANLQSLLVILQCVLVLAKRNLCRGKFIQAQSRSFFCPMLRQMVSASCSLRTTSSGLLNMRYATAIRCRLVAFCSWLSTCTARLYAWFSD